MNARQTPGDLIGIVATKIAVAAMIVACLALAAMLVVVLPML
jgi:hypothetical protein